MRTYRRHLAQALLCCLPVTLLAQQVAGRLPANAQVHVLDGNFKLISTTEGIPANIKEAFVRYSRQPSFAMANPGAKYQVGDVVLDRTLPFRRLVFAGAADDRWFIHYERGGRGHGYYVIVFKVNPGTKAQLLWGGSGGSGARSLDQLRKMIADGEISSEGASY